MTTFFIVIGLVVFYPHYLCGSKAGYGGICRYFNKSVVSYLFGYLNNFFCCTLIAPDNAVSDNFVILVQHNKSVHLS